MKTDLIADKITGKQLFTLSDYQWNFQSKGRVSSGIKCATQKSSNYNRMKPAKKYEK